MTTLALIAFVAAAAAAPAFEPQPVPLRAFRAPQGVFGETLAGFPQGPEGRQALQLSVTERADGSTVVLLTLTGLLDDSVRDEQHRAIVRYRDGGWRVAALGRRWRCQRGRGPAGWTTRPCR